MRPLSVLLLPALWAVPAGGLGAQTGPAGDTARAGGTGAPPPEVQAVRTPEEIRIDGRLDEAAWARAAPVTRFIQVDPEEGRPVSEPTTARVLFDDEAIYIGVRLKDSRPVSARLGRRDMPLSDSDWLGVVLDSYHDHRTAAATPWRCSPTWWAAPSSWIRARTPSVRTGSTCPPWGWTSSTASPRS